MQSVSLILNDGIRFLKEDGIISVSGLIGGYRKIVDGEEFFYHTDLLEISEEQKVEFEGRVREIIREVEILEGKL